MPDRDAAIRTFLEQSGWADADVAPLAGDASNRRYLRLSRKGGAERAVVMDAPTEKGEDVRPFIRIATWLTDTGFSAPRILAADEDQGLLLLEDLGDDLFARVIPDHPALETQLYEAGTDVLMALHDQPPPADLNRYSVPVMTDLAALAYDWYLGAARGADPSAKARFTAAMSDALTQHAPTQDVLIQRDYHSENLLWLPDRDGVARVGLLDFQDAVLGHRAYDLVSLLQDARRDVPPAIETAMIARYVHATGQTPATFDAAYHVLGAQRNLRILGVFARLCVRDGKAHYVDLIPRVWGLLQRDLAHPALADTTAIIADTLPSPDAPLLQILKDKMRHHPRSVMLFAAGFGTRMGALTADRPKPLIDVAGKPLIDHALALIDDFSAAPVVANLHYKPEMLERHLSDRNVLTTRETPEILETGGGLRAALPLLGDGPHFTMNTDAVWRGPNPLRCLSDAWEPDRMDALLLCIPRDQAIGHTGKGGFPAGGHRPDHTRAGAHLFRGADHQARSSARNRGRSLLAQPALGQDAGVRPPLRHGLSRPVVRCGAARRHRPGRRHAGAVGCLSLPNTRASLACRRAWISPRP